MKTNVTFKSHGLTLAGVLYLPDDFMGGQRAGIVCCHPAGGVKEQTDFFTKNL